MILVHFILSQKVQIWGDVTSIKNRVPPPVTSCHLFGYPPVSSFLTNDPHVILHPCRPGANAISIKVKCINLEQYEQELCFSQMTPCNQISLICKNVLFVALDHNCVFSHEVCPNFAAYTNFMSSCQGVLFLCKIPPQ